MSKQEAVGPESGITLREVTAETVRTIVALSVAEAQKQFVASNAVSIAEAYFTKEAWFRAIYAGETPIGFVMLYDNPEKSEYFLWRYMIDQRYQGLGFGRKGIEHLIEYVKTRPGATTLLLSCVPGQEGPENFYRRLGFEPTGNMLEDEMEMKLTL